MQTAMPTTALWVSLLGMCLIVAVRYLAISGLFAWSAKKIRPDVYSPRDPKKAARMARQVKREIAWSLSAAVLYGLPAGLAAHLWATKGLTKIYVDPNTWPIWWIPVSVLLYLSIHDAWFYWTHRAMHHWPWLFKKAHAVHHESRPPTAWAAMAFHPWESLSAAWLIPALTFVIPIHIAALGTVLTIMTFFGVTNHMGWEIFPRRWIEGWFNARRLHSSTNYNSPIEWENVYYRRGDGLAA